MFNYTKEVIINDKGIIKKDGANVVVIRRGGNYDINNIVDKKLYKANGTLGTKAKVTIPFSAPAAGGEFGRLCFMLITPGTELVEFGSPSWQEFGKPFVIESGATTAAAFAEAIKLALPVDNLLLTVEVSGSTVVLTAAETWMDFDNVLYEKVVVNGTEEVITPVAIPADNIVHNVSEFGTAKWIVENLRFPSYPNRRYTPLYADEAPVAGTIYNQFSFQYKAQRSAPGGLAAVGQVVDSIVTIVFYVAPAAEADFLKAFAADGLTVEIPGATAGTFDTKKINASTGALVDLT